MGFASWSYYWRYSVDNGTENKPKEKQGTLEGELQVPRESSILSSFLIPVLVHKTLPYYCSKLLMHSYFIIGQHIDTNLAAYNCT